MSAFHDILFPLRWAFGTTGGPERRTDVTALGSGGEERNAPWAHGRRLYDAGAAMKSLDDLAELVAFFEARRGRLHGFRFRDALDFKSCAPSHAIGPEDQNLGEGDGASTIFPLRKLYGDAAAQYFRPIAKPVVDSVRVAVNGVETDTLYLNEASAVVFEAAPISGAAITAGFLFDVPVRFDSDRLEVSVEHFNAGRIASIPLIEIKI
jgi:uncharacterized protein (TIGR02217 family)